MEGKRWNGDRGVCAVIFRGTCLAAQSGWVSGRTHARTQHSLTYKANVYIVGAVYFYRIGTAVTVCVCTLLCEPSVCRTENTMTALLPWVR